MHIRKLTEINYSVSTAVNNLFIRKVFNSCFKGSILLSDQILTKFFEVFKTLDKGLLSWEL